MEKQLDLIKNCKTLNELELVLNYTPNWCLLIFKKEILKKYEILKPKKSNYNKKELIKEAKEVVKDIDRVFKDKK